MVPLRPLAQCLAAAALSTLSFAEIHIVEPSHSTGLTTIQAAVDLAVDGDTILVRDRGNVADYIPYFTIDGKGLTVIGVPLNNHGRKVKVLGAKVRNLLPGQTVVLRGLELNPRSAAQAPALGVDDCWGTVRLEDCELWASYRPTAVSTVQLEAALDTTFVNCEITGAHASPAVDASNSRIAAYRCTVNGGYGASSASYTHSEAGDGHLGIHLRNRSFAWIGLSLVQGGEGGFADCIHSAQCVALGGDGGNGLEVEPGSVCVALESELLAGEGGGVAHSAQGGGTTGEPGTAVIGNVQVVPGGHRDLDTPLSAPSDGSVPLVLHGVPGERVTLFMGESGGFRFLGPLVGALLVNGDYVGVPTEVGIVPPSGVLEVDVPMALVAIDDARTVHVQALFRTSPTRFRLSPPRMISVMGDAAPFAERPDVIRVDASATGNGIGRTWQHPAPTLHRALQDVPYGEEEAQVWLAAGTYTPAPLSNPLNRQAIIVSGDVSILGGFVGDETAAEQRDPSASPVVLTGDLLGDDRLPGGSTIENSLGLLDMSNSLGDRRCRISGVTMASTVGRGAIRFRGRSLDVDNCSFLDHASEDGAAAIDLVYLYHTDTLTVRDSRFYRNTGKFSGAIHANGSATSGHIQLVGCEFVGNSAERTVQVLSANSRVQYGGVLSAESVALDVDIESCSLLDNDEEAASGAVCCFGGIFVHGNSTVTMENSIVWSHRVAGGYESVYSMIDELAPSASQSNSVHWLPPNWNSLLNAVQVPGFIAAIGADGLWASGDENLRLAPGSPCVDAGNSSLVPMGVLTDLDGMTRFVDDPTAPNVGSGGPRIVDMGAFERQAP